MDGRSIEMEKTCLQSDNSVVLNKYYSALYGELPLDLPQMIPTTMDRKNLNHKIPTNDCASVQSNDEVVADGSSILVSATFPFVQIHTADDTQLVKTNNIFRSNNNQDEIKHETIKFETNDQMKENPQILHPSIHQRNNDNIAAVENSPGLIEIRTIINFLDAFKCDKCSFITINEDVINNHRNDTHFHKCTNDSDCMNVKCPGCPNVFFSKKSLEAHLHFDHFVIAEDMKSILSSLDKCLDERNSTETNTNQVLLRNVDTVTGSTYTLADNTLNTLPYYGSKDTSNLMVFRDSVISNNIPESATECYNTNNNAHRPKQKIFIKSVDVLCEPGLQRQNSNLQNMTNLDNLVGKQNHCIGNVSDNQNRNYNMKCSPKIFLKNVDVLKEPGLFLDNKTLGESKTPQSSLKNTERIEGNGNTEYANCGIPARNYGSHQIDSEGQYGCSNGPGSNIQNPCNNDANSNNNSENDLSTFILESTSNTFTCNLVNFPNETIFGFEPSPIVSLSNSVLDQTRISSPTQFKNKQKIFIKNVDILKEPQHQEHQKGTLHLRTVDELNLMNRNVMESLIKPHLECDTNTNEIILNDISSAPVEKSSSDTIFTSEWIDEYNLTDNIDYITTSNNTALTTTQTTSKINFDLFAPQASVVTIRDIEYLTGTSSANYTTKPFEDNNDLHSTITAQKIDVQRDEQSLCNIPPLTPIPPSSKIASSVTSDVQNVHTPPLMPVRTDSNEGLIQNLQTPEPEHIPIEKGRIYVANNLLQADFSETNVEKRGLLLTKRVHTSKPYGTSVRGRPFGSKKTAVTDKMNGGAEYKPSYKCDYQGCAYRFKISETLDYHKKCHNSEKSTELVVCPECNSTEFRNWNALHTHLWRHHHIDMELYSCDICSFKTPVYSRLINTHSKIHFDERNYKCEQCDKAFKNSKQLKNHRRWHRQSTNASKNIETTVANSKYPSKNASVTSVHNKMAELEYMNQNGNKEYQCNICQRAVSSKSSFKLHMRLHETEKHFKCAQCLYSTSDHNAYRRHKMTHTIDKNYNCKFCTCSFIQSITYQKHLRQKHAELASRIIYKCSDCSFSTIKPSLLTTHKKKHVYLNNFKT